jgi:hypothetical protein
MKENNRSCPEYLFVAWVGKHFNTDSDPGAEQKLHELARHATKEAGLECYWLSMVCIDDNLCDAKKALDVWLLLEMVNLTDTDASAVLGLANE